MGLTGFRIVDPDAYYLRVTSKGVSRCTNATGFLSGSWFSVPRAKGAYAKTLTARWAASISGIG